MKNTNHSNNFFTRGLALTAGIALTTDVYAFAKNLPPEQLLFYSIALIALVLAGFSISYFSYRHLGNIPGLPAGFIGIVHGVISIEISILLLRSFIHFQVPYGYLFLPVVIDIAGAFIFISIALLLQSQQSTLVKIAALVMAVFVIGVAVLVTH